MVLGGGGEGGHGGGGHGSGHESDEEDIVDFTRPAPTPLSSPRRKRRCRSLDILERLELMSDSDEEREERRNLRDLLEQWMVNQVIEVFYLLPYWCRREFHRMDFADKVQNHWTPKSSSSDIECLWNAFLIFVRWFLGLLCLRLVRFT